MRKISKDFSIHGVPMSLRPPASSTITNGHAKRKASTTQARRDELRAKGAYKDEPQYNDRYKLNDIATALEAIYHHKCAYCEQRVEQYQVEHYRPKSNYYWLAFSWDNLLMVCQYCNQYKSNNFQIQGTRADLSAPYSPEDINQLSAEYDLLELPDLVNPELDDPVDKLVFAKDGSMSSPDSRFAYTIATCRLSRSYLNDLRLRILQKFREDIEEQLVIHTNEKDITAGLTTLIHQFKRQCADAKIEFTAFRNFLLRNWIAEEIKGRIPRF